MNCNACIQGAIDRPRSEPIPRGIQKIRARLLVTFDDQWGEEVVNGHTPAPELRAEVVVGVF